MAMSDFESKLKTVMDEKRAREKAVRDAEEARVATVEQVSAEQERILRGSALKALSTVFQQLQGAGVPHTSPPRIEMKQGSWYCFMDLGKHRIEFTRARIQNPAGWIYVSAIPSRGQTFPQFQPEQVAEMVDYIQMWAMEQVENQD